MKKSILVFTALLLTAGAYAQTQRLNRTNTRTHDRSDATAAADSMDKNKPDRMNHRTDMDRNNTNNNTNKAIPNGTGTLQKNPVGGSNTNTNNPR